MKVMLYILSQLNGFKMQNNDEYFQFIFIGNAEKCLSSCTHVTENSSNNNVVADAMVNHLAHEIAETITDPKEKDHNGWKTPISRAEIADKCAYQFGEKTLNNGKSNIQLGSKYFLIQQLWLNGRDGNTGNCVMSTD